MASETISATTAGCPPNALIDPDGQRCPGCGSTHPNWHGQGCPAVRPARRREPRSDEDVVDAVARLIRAVGRRCATADPDSAVYLRMLRAELDAAFVEAVAGWRSEGFSDSQIGAELKVTKQAVQKRWPR